MKIHVIITGRSKTQVEGIELSKFSCIERKVSTIYHLGEQSKLSLTIFGGGGVSIVSTAPR